MVAGSAGTGEGSHALSAANQHAGAPNRPTGGFHFRDMSPEPVRLSGGGGGGNSGALRPPQWPAQSLSAQYARSAPTKRQSASHERPSMSMQQAAAGARRPAPANQATDAGAEAAPAMNADRMSGSGIQVPENARSPYMMPSPGVANEAQLSFAQKTLRRTPSMHQFEHNGCTKLF